MEENNKKSPAKFTITGNPATDAAIISTGVQLISGFFGARRRRKEARRQANAALARQKEQQAILDERIAEYEALTFTNPFLGMENPFEDMTVNQQQARFLQDQSSRQRANVLQSLRSTAGASGIGALAQALVSQGALQTSKISASIGAQEAAIEKAQASQAAKIQQLERTGDVMVQQAESSRRATILGMQQGVMAGVNMNYQQQLMNQAKANQAATQMEINALKSISQLPLEDMLGNTTSTQTTNTTLYGPGDGQSGPPGDMDGDGVPDFVDPDTQ